jgi:SAM-dependent methyltransferase
VDVIFTEHVIEHVSFFSGLSFIQEAFRILKPGGIFRVVAPMVETLISFQNDEIGKRFANEQLKPYFIVEDTSLKKLGFSGIDFDPHPFLLDSLMKKHGHQFIWSAGLMEEVLKKIGFNEVYIVSPGVSFIDPTTALERTIRGTNAEKLIADYGPIVYDPESGVVEARR